MAQLDKIGDAVAEGLASPGAPPDRGPDVVKWAGGRRAVTEALSGMDGPPKPSAYPTDAEYQTARKTWRSAQRTAQRWDAETGRAGKQTRGAGGKLRLTRGEARELRAAAAEVRPTLLRGGMRVRMKAWVEIKSSPTAKVDRRNKTMPATRGEGVPIDRSTSDQIVDMMQDGDQASAAVFLVEAFIQNYGLPPFAEITDVDWCHVWPMGGVEPH